MIECSYISNCFNACGLILPSDRVRNYQTLGRKNNSTSLMVRIDFKRGTENYIELFVMYTVYLLILMCMASKS